VLIAKDLRLCIEHRTEGKDEWLTLTLSDDFNLTEVTSDYLLTPFNTPNRRYHLREGLVIAMRRLVGMALSQGLISDGHIQVSPTVRRVQR
jgi:hypothetical protein